MSLTAEPVGTGSPPEHGAEPFRRGVRLCSRYRLGRVIGSGGMATVWLAEDEVLERPVAVKVISDALAHDAAYVARFEREARIAASVWHPNLVQVYDYSVASGRPFLVMEHLPGGTLDQRLQRVRLSSPELRELTCDLLSALSCIHRQGILHRDVKPANVLFDGLGRARLTDFGIAQAASDSSLTTSGHVMGTLRYLAPEIKEGRRASTRTDLYALGAVLEQVPLRGPADPDLSGLIASLCHPRPEHRPDSADQALEQLYASALAGQPTEEFDVLAVNEPHGADASGPIAATRVLRPPATSGHTLGAPRLAAAGLVVAMLLAALLIGTGGGGAAARKAPAKPRTSSTALARNMRRVSAPTHHAPTPPPTRDNAPSGNGPPGHGPGHGPPGHDGPGHGHGHGD